MDCRKSLVLAGLLSTCLGCVASRNLTVPSGSIPAENITPAKELPRKVPHASTCVAYGNFRVSESEAPNVTPAQKQQLLEQARGAYQQALQIDAKYLPAYTSLARLYSLQGDVERALATYQKALTAHPQEAALWYEMGMCHMRHKQWEPAVDKLTRAVTLDPENRQFTTTFGFSLARAGRFEQSLAVFTPLVGSAEAHYKVARMAHHLKQDEVCRANLRLALKEKPDMQVARLLLDKLEGRISEQPVIQVSHKGPAEAPGAVKPGK